MKTLWLMAAALLIVLATGSLAFAQDGAQVGGAGVGAGLGAGLVIIGAGWGFGRIGSAAVESMARQPEIAAKIQTGAIIIGALLEGATFFALLVCIILQGSARW